MSERGTAPLPDVLAEAKNELAEARKELDRARQQVQSQRESLQQELDSLVKLRDQLAADKAVVEKEAEQFRKDCESLGTSFLAFGELAQELQKRHEDVVQLVQSKHDDLKTVLKILNDSAASLKTNLDSDLGKKLEELQKDQSALELLKRHSAALRESTEALNSRLGLIAGKLSEKKAEDDKGLAELTNSVRQGFEDLTASTTDAISRLEKELAPADEKRESAADVLTKKRQELASTLETLAAQSAVVAKKYQDTVDETRSTVTLIDNVTGVGKSVQANLVQHGKALQKIDESSERMRASAKELEQGSLTLQESARSIASLAEKLAEEKAKDVGQFASLKASMDTNLGRIAGSTKQVVGMLENYSATAKDSREKTAESLAAKRQELESSIERLSKSWEDASKEYGEMTGVMDSAFKEIRLQREELNKAAARLRTSMEKLLAERKSLAEEVATFRTEREKRTAARAKRVCPSCGRSVVTGDLFCDRCGTSLL